MAKAPEKEPASFSMELNLVPDLDEYCRRHQRSRSDAINLAIKLLITTDLAKNPDFWEERYQNSGGLS
jgi:metal-responsive CopG/Arc/MetJ family transcriptional regulator